MGSSVSRDDFEMSRAAVCARGVAGESVSYPGFPRAVFRALLADRVGQEVMPPFVSACFSFGIGPSRSGKASV